MPPRNLTGSDWLIHLGTKSVFKLSCVFVNYASFSAMFSKVANSCSDGSSTENEVSTSMINFLKKKHILLLHAGGDSKRVPWANPMGKVFLPLPYLAADDPDGPAPSMEVSVCSSAGVWPCPFRGFHCCPDGMAGSKGFPREGKGQRWEMMNSKWQ
ncbi:bifunctional fucokinase/fucose pyrophosphorylase isoform X1, partial [Tanacetum coccineum]